MCEENCLKPVKANARVEIVALQKNGSKALSQRRLLIVLRFRIVFRSMAIYEQNIITWF